MPTTAPPLIPDFRTPGAAQPCLSLRLPASIVAGLDAQALLIGTNRSALARALVARGLEQMEQATAAEGVA